MWILSPASPGAGATKADDLFSRVVFSHLRDIKCSFGGLSSFFVVWGASGCHFGGFFLTFAVPSPPGPPLGLPLGHFGRPGDEKGRKREISPSEVSAHFHTFRHILVKQTCFFRGEFRGPVFCLFLVCSGGPKPHEHCSLCIRSLFRRNGPEAPTGLNL